MPKGKDTQVVLDKDALAAISAAVVEGIAPEIQEKVNEAFAAEKDSFTKEIEKVEKNIKKNVETDEPEDDAIYKLGEQDIARMSPQLRLMRAAVALTNGDRETLRELNS